MIDSKKVQVKLSPETVAQCRDRARLENISLPKLVKRAIAQYLLTPASEASSPPSTPSVTAPSVTTTDYARLVARVEQLEMQLAQMRLMSSTTPPAAGLSSGVVSAEPDDNDEDDLDEPDEILYDFLETPRPSS